MKSTGDVFRVSKAFSNLMLMYLHRWRHEETYGSCCPTFQVSNNGTIRVSGGYKSLRANWMQQAFEGWPL